MEIIPNPDFEGSWPNPDFEAWYERAMHSLTEECEERGVHGLCFAYNMALVGLTAIRKEIGETGYQAIREEIEKNVSLRCKSDI